MGLAAPRKRTRISTSFNAKWTSSVNSFGHKILTSQGWNPGDYLGAQNVSQESHYSLANSEPIKIAVKDDVLGLGAKRRPQSDDEITGLDAFQSVLGRLNGKTTEELAKIEETKKNIRAARYIQSRWVTMQFVRGGLLKPDNLLLLPPEERKEQEKREQERKEAEANESAKTISDTKSSETSENDAAKVLEKERKRLEKAEKKKRKELKRRLVLSRESENAQGSDETDKNKESEAELMTKEQRRLEKAERKKRREERRARKLKKRLEREGHKEKKHHKHSARTSESESSNTQSELDTTTTTGTVTPAMNSGSTTDSSMLRGRLSVRQRYIQQKHMASLDVKALGEIFMMKAR